MSNESLRATLNQALNEYALERRRILGKIQNCRNASFDVETNLKRAQEAERQAIFADDETTRKANEVLDHYNSLPEPRPQALLEQYNALIGKQYDTHRIRMDSHRLVEVQIQQVEQRRIQLGVAEQDLKTIDARIAETMIEIKRLGQS